MNLSLVTECAAELASSLVVEGTPIDVIRTGSFTDMNRRKVTVTPADLDTFIRNHAAQLAGQEIPVDVDHRRQEAAGWIVRFFRDGDVLKAVPAWNAHGSQLVSDQMYRYISATIDLAKKVIISVSLTNFPAVKQLAPISLSEYPADDQESDAASNSDVVLLFSQDGEKQMTRKKKDEQQAPEEEIEVVDGQGDDAELSEGDERPATLSAHTEIEIDDDAVTVDLSAEIEQMRTEMRNEMRQLMQDQMRESLGTFQQELASTVALSAEERSAIIRETMSGIREEQELAEFAAEVTGTGTHALPMRAETLRTQLSGIPKPHRAVVMDILRTVHESGTVDFSEEGTSQGSNSTLRLDKETSDILVDFMDGGGTVKEFFDINKEDLGDMAQYDLSAFSK